MSETTQDPDPSKTPSVTASNAATPSVAVPALPDGEFAWHRLIGVDELDVGRVTTVTVERESLCVTRTETGFGCLANACPHQGGPLGEGSIEGGWLRCPWHGYDYSPNNGKPPPPFNDAPAAYRTDVRPDGVYVALPATATRTRTVSDQLVETMTAWGVGWVFGMVGHSNLGFADALREAEARGSLQFIGVRHEGAASFAATAYGKLTGSLAACFAIAGPGSTNLLTGLYDAKMDRAPVLALSGQVPSSVRGRGAFQDTDLSAAFADVARYSQTVQAGSDATELMNLACKTASVERDVAHLVLCPQTFARFGHAACLVGLPQRCCFSARVLARSRRWAASSSGERLLALRQRRWACRRRVSTVWLGWSELSGTNSRSGPKCASMGFAHEL